MPRRPAAKNCNILTEARYQIQLAYYRYEINTALYVMSPGEKLAYNTIVLGLLGLLVISVFYYFPNTLRFGVQRLGYYITGTSGSKIHVEMPDARRVLVDRSMEAVSSLRDAGGMANASSVFES